MIERCVGCGHKEKTHRKVGDIHKMCKKSSCSCSLFISPKKSKNKRTRILMKFQVLERARQLYNEGTHMMCRKGDFIEARRILLQARDLFPSESDKARAKRNADACIDFALGISDGTTYGGGFWLNGDKITHLRAHELRVAALGGTYKARGRIKITIREIVYQIYDQYDLPEDAPYEKVLKAVKLQKPDSKFDESHHAYYRSKYKKLKKGG